MEYISALDIFDFINNERVNNKLNRDKNSGGKANPFGDSYLSGNDDPFSGYLNWHGLANEPDMLILSSDKHYYYDYDDLKGVKTLINQKKLNHIKQLNDFLYNVHSALSPKTNFIGCFSDRSAQKGVSLTSRMFKKIIDFLDSRIEFEFDKKDISRLLEAHGFKIIDMTEINGVTYFLTQN